MEDLPSPKLIELLDRDHGINFLHWRERIARDVETTTRILLETGQSVKGAIEIPTRKTDYTVDPFQSGEVRWGQQLLRPEFCHVPKVSEPFMLVPGGLTRYPTNLEGIVARLQRELMLKINQDYPIRIHVRDFNRRLPAFDELCRIVAGIAEKVGVDTEKILLGTKWNLTTEDGKVRYESHLESVWDRTHQKVGAD